MKKRNNAKRNRGRDSSISEDEWLWAGRGSLPTHIQNGFANILKPDSYILHHKLEICEAEKIKIDKRAENRRFSRRIHAERQEAETEERVLGKNECEMQSEQKARLAQEMDNIHQEEMREAKLRQNLRESSIELRDLEAKLRAACVSKDLATQIAEKKAARLEEKLQEKEAVDFMRSVWEREGAAEAEKEAEEYRRKLQYRAELQDQMVCAKRSKQVASEDILQERKILDEAARRIHDEDQRKFESKMLNVQKTRQEMEALQKAKDACKQKEREEIEEEKRQIEQYLANQRTQEQKRMMELQEKEAQRAIFMQKVARHLYEMKAKIREEEEIMQLFVEEERKEEMVRQQQREVEGELQRRTEAQQAYHDQMAAKMKKLQQEAQEAAAYKQQLIAESAKSEHLEQLSAEKRRLQILEYQQSLNKFLEERQQRRSDELQCLLHLQELEREQEKARKRVIEEERLRILKEQASKLIGYLPRGILREDDLPHLGSEFMGIYGHKMRDQ